MWKGKSNDAKCCLESEMKEQAVITLLAFVLLPVFGMGVVLAYGLAVAIWHIVRR